MNSQTDYSTRVEIEQANGSRRAVVTDDLEKLLSRVREGDGFTVEYKRNGLDVEASGTVRKVSKLDGRFDDMFLRTSNGEAYLHVHPGGAYYFRDPHPETADLGRVVTALVLRPDR